MNIISNESRPVMDFYRIRNGTVFTCEGKAYIKGDDENATDLRSGHVLQPQKDDSGADWSKCCIYNKASLNLI